MDTEVLAILDMSGSMGERPGMAAETISGFNVWLAKVAQGQQQGERVTITVTTFDTLVETHVKRMPIKECPQLGTPGNPYMPRGGTALFDAVGDTLSGVKEFVPEGKKALVMIVTDGEENSSRRWNHAKLGELMAELEKTSRYSFLYMGAGVDSWAQARSYGDTSGMATRSASFDPSKIGVAFASAGLTGMGYVGDHATYPGRTDNLGAQVMAGIAEAEAEDEADAREAESLDKAHSAKAEMENAQAEEEHATS